MNRQLLILTNDGGKEDFLPGIEHDKERFEAFFRSCYGGAWEDNEIFCPITNSMNRKTLLEVFQMTEERSHVDYWIIVFCGHGGADEQGRTFLQLAPNDKPIYIDEIENALANSRLLLIADSCRSLPMMESGGTIPRIMMFSDSTGMSGYRGRCRTMYNDKIASTPSNLHTIGYATQLWKYARERENGSGGQYSQALLDCAKRQIDIAVNHRDDADYVFDGEIASFSNVHACAKSKVNFETKGKQMPQLFTPRTAQLPFWVVAKKGVTKFRRKE